MKNIETKKIFTPINKRVIQYLDELAKMDGIVHPDINERMYKLNQACNVSNLFKYKNSQVLISSKDGNILAIAFGTAYLIRANIETLRNNSILFERIIKWSDGETLDLSLIGNDWIRGGWHKNENDWINAIVV